MSSIPLPCGARGCSLFRFLVIPFWVACSLLGAAEVRAGDTVRGEDLNGDGWYNVLDVYQERRDSRTVGVDRLEPSFDAVGSETIRLEPERIEIQPGTTQSFLVILESNTIPLFGYSLDVHVTPVGADTAPVMVEVAQTNFFPTRNLILAAGAMMDPVFSQIVPSSEGGVFVTANTDDVAVAVLADSGVNDVLAEVFISASAGKPGAYVVELGPASVLSDENGVAVPFSFEGGDVVVPVERTAWSAIKALYATGI